MAYIMTSLIGTIIEGNEKGGKGGGKGKGEDVFVLQTKDKFCSSAETNEEPDDWIN
jgi:hypothetical protein